MKIYQIKPLPTIRLEVDMGIFTYRMNYGTKMWVPILMWYIVGSEKRILVDTGAKASFAKEFRKLKAEDIMSFDKALESVNLKAEDIDIVIQTHLHWDHCVNLAKCKNAKVIVQEDELKYAFSPHPIMANLYHRPLFKDINFKVVKGPYEVVPGIELFPAPGHTPGIQAVAVNTEKGTAVISGFCSIMANFDPPAEAREFSPVIPVGTHTDLMQAFDSALRVKGLADILIPQHDPSFLEVKCIP